MVNVQLKKELILWGFSVKVKDRRTEQITDGFIVIAGEDTEEYDEAENKIRKEYERLGYTVLEHSFDADHFLNIDLMETYGLLNETAPCCRKCIHYIRGDGSVGQNEDCQIAIDADEEGNTELSDEMISEMCNGGRKCKYCEFNGMLEQAALEAKREIKPNFIAELNEVLAKESEGENE